MTASPDARGGAAVLAASTLIDTVAARTSAPGGGVVLAVVSGLAAALGGMSARFAEGEPSQLAERTDQMQNRALELAERDLVAYDRYMAARRQSRPPDEVALALDELVAVPLEIASLAAEVATMALRLVDDGNPRLRGDAATAVLLAASATRAAAVLVCENLRGAVSRTPLDQARDAVGVAGRAEQALLAQYPELSPPEPA